MRSLVKSFAQEFRDRISIHVVRGGNRSTPLNEALRLAKGDYFVSLDDDDLVFANWVEVFRDGSLEQPGATVRAQCLSQTWAILGDENSTTYAVSEASAAYPRVFNMSSHFSNNFTPNMSVAFPMKTIRAAKLNFDETLDTAEDWDFMMRCIAASNIKNIPTPTAIYRKWRNAPTSAEEHAREIWLANLEKIRNKFRHLVFPVAAHEIIGLTSASPPIPFPRLSAFFRVSRLAFKPEVWRLAWHYRIFSQLASRKISVRQLVTQVDARMRGEYPED
jgi:glycosyltransferase involved in cell wall biosynthesis